MEKRGILMQADEPGYLYAMVPYVITEDELVQVIQTMKEWFKR